MTATTMPYVIKDHPAFSTLDLVRDESDSDKRRGEMLYGPEGVRPFTDLASQWEADFDSTFHGISRETLLDRRMRLADLLDMWLATLPMSRQLFDRRKEEMGDQYEPSIRIEYPDSIREALQGRIFRPLHRFAAVGVASDLTTGRAAIGQIHTGSTLDKLGAALLVGGMGFGPHMWDPINTRYLVMNLDRDRVDPSLNLANLVGGLLMAERSWPESA